MVAGPGLRELKKERTRKALIAAAADLFEQHGYEATGVADIAAAAEVSTSTFFRYFTSKEAVLFADAQERVQRAIEVIGSRAGDLRPAEVLVEAVDTAIGSQMEMFARLGSVRTSLLLQHPALRGLMAGQVEMADQEQTVALRQAYPDRLDDLTAAAMVGALIGCLVGVATQILSGPSTSTDFTDIQAALRRAAGQALVDLAAAASGQGV